MEIIILAWATLFGIVIGSFLNVCIYRIPKGLSILFPGSVCTKCNSKISWYDNIPILGYLILRGRCRNCKEKFSVRYIFIEFFTGLITFLFLYYLFFSGSKPLETVIVYILLTYILIVITFIDFDYLIVPNSLTYSGMIFVLVISVLIPGIFEYNNNQLGTQYVSIYYVTRWHSLFNCLIGIIVSGGIVFATAIIGRCILKKDVMGIGDVKLMCMSGGIIGWKLGIIVFFIAPFFGILMAIPVMLKKNTRMIPYAPFLSIAIIVSIFFEDYFLGIVDSYIEMFRYLF